MADMTKTVYLHSSDISIKSTTMMPPISLRRNSRAIWNKDIAQVIPCMNRYHSCTRKTCQVAS